MMTALGQTQTSQQTQTQRQQTATLDRQEEFFAFQELPSLDETYSNSLQCLMVVGTRSEAIKLAPLVLSLKDSGSFAPVVIATGEENGVVEDILSSINVEPTINLKAGTDSDSDDGNLILADVITRLEEFCQTRYRDTSRFVASEEEIRRGQYPAAMITAGDSFSALAASLAGSNMRIPVMHVEAGLSARRREDFPLGRNRRLISQLACFHFAPNGGAEENLIREGVASSRILVSGSTTIDSLKWAAGLKVATGDEQLDKLIASERPIVLIAAHEIYNWGGNFSALERAIGQIIDRVPEVNIVIPYHPSPRGRQDICERLQDNGNIFVGGPLSYPAFAHLLARSDLVITDSSGISEGAPSLDTPVLVARAGNRAHAGPSAGTLLVDGSSASSIAETAIAFLENETLRETLNSAVNPYGDGHAGERIAAALEHLFGGGLLPCSFGEPYSRKAILQEAGYEEIIK